MLVFFCDPIFFGCIIFCSYFKGFEVLNFFGFLSSVFDLPCTLFFFKIETFFKAGDLGGLGGFILIFGLYFFYGFYFFFEVLIFLGYFAYFGLLGEGEISVRSDFSYFFTYSLLRSETLTSLFSVEGLLEDYLILEDLVFSGAFSFFLWLLFSGYSVSFSPVSMLVLA